MRTSATCLPTVTCMRPSRPASSICSTIGMMDIMWGAKNVAATTFISVGPYMVAALIYFCINFPASKAIEAIERRMRRGDK